MKAFPLTNTNTQHTGMDLRDYFATAVLQAYISIPDLHTRLKESETTVEDITESAYGWADAMLEQRQR